MKNECNIIRDLLPLYAENMVSPGTAEFVEEHLKSCELCRNEYESIKEPQPTPKISDSASLLKLSRKMKVKKIQTVALTVVFVITLLVSAFAVLAAPIYLPYSEKLITVEPVGDSGLRITFDKAVTDFDYTVYDDPDGADLCYCDIQAWTSLWDKWFSRGKGILSATVATRNDKPIIAVYVPNDRSENICIAKYDPKAEVQIDKNADYESTIALPRLSLGYYLIFAAAALAVAGVVWLFVRKKAQARVWTERIGLYPIAYIISHCVVSGIKWSSYSLPRDLALIVFISILLYSGLLLAHNILRFKREIKEINQ